MLQGWAGCLVQTMPSLTWERTSFNSPRLTTRPRWYISDVWLNLSSSALITRAISERWGFYDRIPCHGVTRFPVIKPGHSKTSGRRGQGEDIFQLLVPHFLSAALWHWHGWRKKQVHSTLSCQKSKYNPLIYKSTLSGWCTACYRCLENHFFSITSDLGAF